MINIIPFRYAYLQRGKSWEVVFYQVNPFEGNKLQRVRIRINNVPEATREKHGLKLCDEINKKLDRGQWNYFTDKNNARPLAECFGLFMAGKNLRPASVATYRSVWDMWRAFMVVRFPGVKYVHQVSREAARAYFYECLLLEKKYKARTFNNTLINMRSIFNFFVKEGLCPVNVFKEVARQLEDENTGVIIPRADLDKLFTWLQENDAGFYCVCSLIYYGLIRRSEISKLQLFRIDFEAGLIRLPGSITKNRKNKTVVIPSEFLGWLLGQGYDRMPAEFYICAAGGAFLPGPVKIAASRISEHWRKVARGLGFPKEYEFYQLKDTGNTHLEEAGISSASIRDQAGWRYLQQRNTYTHTTGESLAKLRDFKRGDFKK